MNKLEVLMVIFIVSVVSAFLMINEKLSEEVVEVESPLIWIDDYRFHKDSIPYYSPILNINGEKIGEWIELKHGDTSVYVECVDIEGHSWKEFKDSFIITFKEATL